MPERYHIDNYSFIRTTKDSVDVLTNFTAQITKEITYHDGNRTTTHLEIEGEMAPLPIVQDNPHFKLQNDRPPRKLAPITIPASEFAGLGWIAEKWGMQPIIFPVPSGERDLRTAIQLLSTPTKHHIYTHTGWTLIKDKPHFLTMSGGINDKGLDDSIAVSLPHELSHYRLPAPADNRDAFLASLRIINMGPKELMWPALLAAYRAVIRPADFTIHVAGRTGTYKSELTSLIQSHYGQAMDARHLPASWSSTANALEHLSYRAKDCVMAIDDFIPVGTSYQVRQLQKSADQIVRAQANQSGRSRLTDTTSMQTTYYPRGLLFSTGEDVPEGHSLRGRCFILELKPGDITAAKLTEAQQHRPMYPQALADWIQWLATNPERAEDHRVYALDVRDQNLGTGHSRTPEMIGNLIATAKLMTVYAVEKQWIAQVTANDIFGKARKAILLSAENQRQYLEASDPVRALCETIRSMMASNLAHAKTRSGGIPEDAELWGWTKEQRQGELANYRSNGPTLGYVNPEEQEFLFDPGSLPMVKKYSGGKLAVTAQTLLKRVRESGILTRVDDSRERHTVRVSIDGHQRSVLAIQIAEIENAADDAAV